MPIHSSLLDWSGWEWTVMDRLATERFGPVMYGQARFGWVRSGEAFPVEAVNGLLRLGKFWFGKLV